jgi:hypothetical protein
MSITKGISKTTEVGLEKKATVLAINCTGIGAYDDDQTQEFLGTNQDILYALAIAR